MQLLSISKNHKNLYTIPLQYKNIIETITKYSCLKNVSKIVAYKILSWPPTKKISIVRKNCSAFAHILHPPDFGHTFMEYV